MTVLSISAVEKPGANTASGLDGLQNRLMEKLHQSEDNITGNIRQVLEPSNFFDKYSKQVQEKFRLLESQARTPEQAELIRTIRTRMEELNSHRGNILKERVEFNAKKFEIELSAKAMGKVTNGIQQLISSS